MFHLTFPINTNTMKHMLHLSVAYLINKKGNQDRHLHKETCVESANHTFCTHHTTTDFYLPSHLKSFK